MIGILVMLSVMFRRRSRRDCVRLRKMLEIIIWWKSWTSKIDRGRGRVVFWWRVAGFVFVGSKKIR